jgi:hypothetical protein
MSRDVLLAADLIGSLLRPGAREGDAEGAALRLASIEERLASTPDHERLRLTGEAISLDADDLPPQGWIWLLESLSEHDSEFDDHLLDQLYSVYPDPLLRLRLVDATLAHPRIAGRFEEVAQLVRSGRRIPLSDLPHSWPGKWLVQRLGTFGEETREGFPLFPEPAGAIAEMSLYLVQIGTETALTILAAALSEEGGRIVAAREGVTRIIDALRENGADMRGLGPMG